MPKTLNILSIDFDFFQNVSADTIAKDYPDGIDLPTDISTLVWSSHYTNPICKTHLMTVTPATTKLKELQKIIHDKKTTKTKSCICNSHVHAYDFIFTLLSKHPDCTTINLYNLDMHHDILNENEELDCGNWIRHVKQDSNQRHVLTKIHWICNPVSLQLYGLETQKDILTACHIQTDLSKLWNYRWHGIFLCRSDNWLPPHLDTSFVTFAKYLKQETHTWYADPKVMKSRYTTEFQKNINQMESFLKTTYERRANS